MTNEIQTFPQPRKDECLVKSGVQFEAFWIGNIFDVGCLSNILKTQLLGVSVTSEKLVFIWCISASRENSGFLDKHQETEDQGVFVLCVTDEGTHARAGGGTFPAVGDVGLVGVVGVAQQRAGGWSPAAPRGAGFTELDSTFFLAAVLRCGGLTPLRMSHPWRDVLTDYRRENRCVRDDSKMLFVPLAKRCF